MSWFPWALAALGPLVLGPLSAYYRWRWKRAESALRAIADTRAEWAAHNKILTERLARTEAALVARHEAERADDQATVTDAATDAERAAALLRGL